MGKANINGSNIYYQLKGNLEAKETIVFLNGVMFSANSWNNQVAFFEKLGYKILVHDFKGQLKSDKLEAPYTFKKHAEDTKQLLDKLEIKKAHFIGTSYGGEVGLCLAIYFPDIIKTLCVIDSVSQTDALLEKFVKSWKNLVHKQNGEVLFSGIVPTVYDSSFIEKNSQFLKTSGKSFNKLDKDFYTGQYHLYDTFLNDVKNIDKKLKLIKNPTLFICGQNDILKLPKFSERMQKLVPNSEYVLIPHCGHVVILEKPDILNSVLLGFLKKHNFR